MNRFEETFSVGERYRATFILMTGPDQKPVEIRCEWDPATPKMLSELERAQYRRGRDAALEKLANASGVAVALVEI